MFGVMTVNALRAESDSSYAAACITCGYIDNWWDQIADRTRRRPSRKTRVYCSTNVSPIAQKLWLYHCIHLSFRIETYRTISCCQPNSCIADTATRTNCQLSQVYTLKRDAEDRSSWQKSSS